MASTKTAFLSHKATDGELAKRIREIIHEILPIEIFLSEEIPKSLDFRQEIRSALDRAECFILLFTNPKDDWSWCFYEVGLYSCPRPEPNNSDRPIYCLHLQDTPSPSPLANLQTVKAIAGDLEIWIKNLCGQFKCRPPSREKIRTVAKKIEQGFKTRSIVTERGIKPFVWVTAPWPTKTRPNFNAAKLPAIHFEDAEVLVDDESAIMLGFRGTHEDYTLEQFLARLDCDSSANTRQRPYWMAKFFEFLAAAVSEDLKMQEVAFFRHEEGIVLRPIIVSVAKSKDASVCKLKVLFTRTVSPPVTDHPNPVQRLADGVRLGVRTRIEVIDTFSGRMSQIYRDKVMSDSPIEEVARNFPVGGRMIKALEAIHEEAMAHGFRPGEPPPRVFPNNAEQKLYEGIRAKGIRLWDELAMAAKKEDQEAKGKYVQSEKLLAELKKVNFQYLEIALPRLKALLRSAG